MTQLAFLVSFIREANWRKWAIFQWPCPGGQTDEVMGKKHISDMDISYYK